MRILEDLHLINVGCDIEIVLCLLELFDLLWASAWRSLWITLVHFGMISLIQGFVHVFKHFDVVGYLIQFYLVQIESQIKIL